MNSQTKNSNTRIDLLALKENRVEINQKIAFLYIGIVGTESIFLRLINNEQLFYEGIFSKIEIQRNINADDIKTIYDWILSIIVFNNFILKYNEDKSQIFFIYNNFIRNAGIQERITLKLNLKKNENDKIIINNSDNLELLKDFNYQYKTNITLYDPIINLQNRSINNQGFKNLCQLELNITVLSLENNNISDLSPLGNNSFKTLQKLILSYNNINNIKSLYNLTFENLIELKFDHNKINDITALEGTKMKKIERLFLNCNNISDIEVFQKVNFENLTHLILSKNYIKNISSSFENNDFVKLIELNLSHNIIVDISILEKVELNSLEDLNLSHNEIDKILVKKKFSFPKLKHLHMNNNNIKAISILGRILLPKLKLFNNIIEKIDIDKFKNSKNYKK